MPRHVELLIEKAREEYEAEGVLSVDTYMDLQAEGIDAEALEAELSAE